MAYKHDINELKKKVKVVDVNVLKVMVKVMDMRTARYFYRKLALLRLDVSVKTSPIEA